MAQTISQTVTITEAQAADALTGNGTAVDVTGANAVLFVVAKNTTGAAGIFTFEESFDDGENWSSLSCTRVSSGATATASSAAESGETFVAVMKDGDRQVRARISTNWTTASPAVNVVALSR